jgi:hypothetical protein
MEFKTSPPYASEWGYYTIQTMGIILVHHNHSWWKGNDAPPIHHQMYS